MLYSMRKMTSANLTFWTSFKVVEILPSYGPLVDGRVIVFDCEPRPFNYHLVDRGPDQKKVLSTNSNSSHP